MPEMPNTITDIVWNYHKCDECGTETGYMKGSEPTCVQCSLDNGDTKIVKEYTAQTVYGNEEVTLIGNEESDCLQDTLNTSDPQTLSRIKSECASVGCNICLSETSFDDIEWPKHYNQGKIQPIDVIEDWDLDFRLANTIKYVARAGKKNPHKTKEDLEKAIWYIQRYIDKEL